MVTEIKELQILPPLSIGRCGSSADPMDNYEAVVDRNDPAGFRKLVPAETLIVDPTTGEIREATTPQAVKFRDSDGHIRPVAPFFEVWARFADLGLLEPLTANHLAQLGLKPADVQWRVRVGNHKASRRTGQAGDNVDADSGVFSDHAPQPLSGQAANFAAGSAISLGTVQYLNPNAAFPEIRLRFTPAAGKIYGPVPTAGATPDPNVTAHVYNGAQGTWVKHTDDPDNPLTTKPPGNYAYVKDPATQAAVCLGYLDDTCDGLIEVQLPVNGRPLTAYARIAVGPPDFAPDSFHVRAVSDELEQILLGPQVADQVTVEEIVDLIRRSLETMRLLNIEFYNNIAIVDQHGQASPAFNDGANYNLTLARHARIIPALSGLNLPAGSSEREKALNILRSILMHARTYDQTADDTPQGHQRMPALMRGADDKLLALTRRQIGRIEKALRDHGG